MDATVFRTVIGLAYPDAFQPVDADPRTEKLPQISEPCFGFPPLMPHCNRDTIVHFDMGPLNGEIQELGNWRYDIWAARRRGKTRILTPFGEKWGYVNSAPQAARQQTVGNFNWRTNLYQVGPGMDLLDHKFAHVDAELRNLVVLCLCYNPTRRPSMQVMESEVQRHVAGRAVGSR
ncbi:hypothetical protein MMYC01_208404 [Madurella mycetomatis]|uniref:Protein kinase domain-containing protein n=1 Tax=Madurella mycetomatis TaxID=100816 RepID=A0A175VWK6_9PEZI|nr:hypothetical protein MMYC01_208404 [Madurella mycetomatis]